MNWYNIYLGIGLAYVVLRMYHHQVELRKLAKKQKKQIGNTGTAVAFIVAGVTGVALWPLFFVNRVARTK